MTLNELLNEIESRFYRLPSEEAAMAERLVIALLDALVSDISRQTPRRYSSLQDEDSELEHPSSGQVV
jgi:hypothetical protein